jgi:hypothetical protein
LKKYLWILPALFLVVSITVWGFNAEKGVHPLVNRSVVNESKAGNETRSENDNALFLLDELIEQSEVAEKLKSYAVDLSLVQIENVQEGDKKDQQKVNISIKQEYINDPIQMHVLLNMKSGKENNKLEQYVMKDDMYTSVDGIWMYTKEGFDDDLLQVIEDNIDVSEQLHIFTTMQEKTKITTEGENYVIEAQVSGADKADKAKKLAKEIISGNFELDNDSIQMMNIKDLNVISKIQKRTFYPLYYKLKIIMDGEQAGKKVSMELDMTIDVFKHNNIKKINIPQKALNSAKY